MGEIEKKAKEVLASLQVNCPDKLWQDLSFELEQGPGASEGRWKNKISTPQVLILVLLVITASSFFLWKYLSGRTDTVTYKYKPPAPAQAPKPAPPTVHNTPPPVVKDTVKVVKSDSLPKSQNTNAETSKLPTTQPGANKLFVSDKEHAAPTADQKQLLPAKRDSIIAARRKARKIKDSLAAKAAQQNAPDTLSNRVRHVRMHDSSMVKGNDTIK